MDSLTVMGPDTTGGAEVSPGVDSTLQIEDKQKESEKNAMSYAAGAAVAAQRKRRARPARITSAVSEHAADASVTSDDGNHVAGQPEPEHGGVRLELNGKGKGEMKGTDSALNLSGLVVRGVQDSRLDQAVTAGMATRAHLGAGRPRRSLGRHRCWSGHAVTRDQRLALRMHTTCRT